MLSTPKIARNSWFESQSIAVPDCANKKRPLVSLSEEVDAGERKSLSLLTVAIRAPLH
jgi:hypothetical protein